MRRQERRGRGEKKSNRLKSPLLRLLFFSPRIFFVFPEVKNNTTRGGKDRKSPKRSKKRALYHQSHEDRDGRPRRERKDPKGGKVKEAPTEGVAKTKSARSPSRAREGKTEKATEKRATTQLLTVLWAPSSLRDKRGVFRSSERRAARRGLRDGTEKNPHRTHQRREESPGDVY